MLSRQSKAEKVYLLSESLALTANAFFFLEPQCDQFEICSTKIRLPFSDLASTLNVENIRPKSTRNTKNLSSIFLQKELEKLVTRCGRINLRVIVFKLFWLVTVLVHQLLERQALFVNQKTLRVFLRRQSVKANINPLLVN